MKINTSNILANEQQRKASDPSSSVWVSASAGTGKTKVLIDRILRILLLEDDIKKVEINKILCITFTKAAAKEMIDRLMNVLSKWSILENDILSQEIKELTGDIPTNETLDVARKLFHKVLDAPQKLNIQTIHSFCQNILSRFPIEANVPTNFTVIEDITKQKLKDEAILEFLQELKNNNTLQQNIHNNIGNYYSFEKNMKMILDFSQEIELMNYTYKVGDNFSRLKETIYQTLNAEIGISEEDLIKNYLIENQKKLDEIKIAFELLKQNEKKLSYSDNDKVLKFLNGSLKEKIKGFDIFQKIFIKTDGKARESKIASADTINFLNINTNFIKDFPSISQSLLTLIEKVKNQKSALINETYLDIVFNIYYKYQNIKLRNNYLDFDDLIMKTYELLAIDGINSWIMYKLDTEISHILVDEAQDTSPFQWEIIKCLIQEFFSGIGVKENNPSIFVVGDIKQSIYSFQKADPLYFAEVRQYLEEKIKASQNKFEEVAMNTSFRSSKGVIDLVNNVSKNLFDTSKKPYQNEELYHIAYNQKSPFSIEIWPFISRGQEEEKIEKHKKLANNIVKKIILLQEDYNIDYQDIMILYKKRENNPTLDFLIKKLKSENIPVLGVDKINLNENIIIQDFISLINVLLQKEDCFSLANVLKSPFFNLSDKDILDLKKDDIKQNKKTPLVNLLKVSKHNDIYQQLVSWQQKVDILSPYDLFFEIIYNNNYITKIIKRLGIEYLDPINEFMNLILRFQSNNPSNLYNFLQFINTHTNQIKRELSKDSNHINLSTIHGSKGLEAKVIFLLDDLDKSSKENNFFFNKDSKTPLLLFKPKKSYCASYIEEIVNQDKNNLLEEEKRLLYVALTRAKEHLYLCFISEKEEEDIKEKRSSLWWQQINENIENIKDISLEEKEFFSEKNGFIKNKAYILNNIKKENIKNPTKLIKQYKNPKWVNEKALPEPFPTKPLTPSKIDFEEKYFASPLEMVNTTLNPAINKGLIIHKILEQITSLNSNILKFVENFLNSQNTLKDNDKQAIYNSLKNIIENKELNFLFDKDSYNEVSLSGLIKYDKKDQIIMARIDKIIKKEDKIIIVDYKFSTFKNKVYPKYIKQMSIYKSLLQNIYPDINIICYILYTQNPKLIEVKTDNQF